MLGLSGATINIYDDRVDKICSKENVNVAFRLIDQAYFINKHQCPIFPIIFKIFSNEVYGYSMEKLDSIEYSEITPNIFNEIKDLLSRYIWCQKAEVFFNENKVYEIHRYVYNILNKLPLNKTEIDNISLYVFINLKQLLDLNLTSCLIHGDPTIANCVRRNKKHLVILDPIPSDLWPHLKAVDLGKMLQSAIGYEAWLNNMKSIDPKESLNTVLLNESEDDIKAAEIFLLIHLIRLIPYQTDDNKKILSGRLNELCI